MTATTVPLASVDPRSLSAAQRRALRLLKSGAVLHRGVNKFGRTGNSVALDVARSLVGLGLVSMPPGKPLALSYGGRFIADLIDARAAPSGAKPPTGGDSARTEG